MTHGIVMHAYNNEQIDYSLIALCNALMIKENLNVPVCLITYTGCVDWLVQSRGQKLVDKAFDHVVIQDLDNKKVSKKRFGDTPHSSHTLPWYNTTRTHTYNLTPFDETLLIDSDYLVMDKNLNVVWGSAHDVMISKEAISLSHHPMRNSEKWLDDTGIKMCWATCLYFKKSKTAETLFDLVNHIKANYEYYAMVYGFDIQLYRNDFAFSVAVHMMNGFVPDGEEIQSLPFSLLTSFDCDDLIDVPAKNEMKFLINDRKENWKFYLTKTKEMNVHVLNKFAILRQAEKFLEYYG
jgi:hypothetical protein